jgi:two-component system, NtrC family, response regulator HydG
MQKILIIDDEEGIRQMLYVLLSGEGYEVKMAKDGEEGLTLTDSFAPEIIILDLNMPKLDGMGFLKKLQPGSDLSYSVIVLTGFGTDETVQACYQLGVHSFIRKPVNLHEILGLVKRNLELVYYAEQLKRAKEEKETAYQLLKKTFDGMSEGVMTLDNSFKITMLSKKACQILDVSAAKALNRPAVSILGKTVAGPLGIVKEVLNDGNDTSEHETFLLLPNGAKVPVQLTIKGLGKEESREGWLFLFRDKREEARAVRDQVGGTIFGRMVSNDSKMLEIFNLIDQIASSDVTVLIEGGSGTGKELVAREIHDRSRRAQMPFHTINCAAIPFNLLESELFGHERGAFTGAEKEKKGRFEVADRGTLFLDEIGDMPLPMQVKLLRVLQEQTFEHVGGTKPIHVNVRIIAATNQHLKELILKKQFREDLFHRLDVITIDLPPLRDRIQDIPLLASYFIKKLNETEDRQIKRLSANVSLSLMAYHWPGNVRELYHVIEHAFAVSNSDTIRQKHLPDKLRPTQASNRTHAPMRKNEKEIILQALKQSSYDKKIVSNLLGVSLATLYRKIKKYKIKIH